MKVDDHLWVYDSMIDDDRSWRAHDVSYIFSSQLVNTILAIPIPIHQSQYLRVWDWSCWPKIPVRDLIELSKTVPNRRIHAA